jgi:hypothetical protein
MITDPEVMRFIVYNRRDGKYHDYFQYSTGNGSLHGGMEKLTRVRVPL